MYRSSLYADIPDDPKRLVRIWREGDGLFVKVPSWRKAKGPCKTMEEACGKAAEAIGHGFKIAFGKPL